ncbi:MAG: signal peptidase I [Actinobacteria bacterium]|nr:signal peptidase I [Actinomycetota bacterium]
MDNRYNNPYGWHPQNMNQPPYYNVPPGGTPPPPIYQKPPPKSARWKLTLGGSLALLPLLLLTILFLTVVLIGSPYVVRGSSMYPTLKDGDRVFVVPYRGNTTPSRGDVVVLKNVPGSNELLIKRIIALQGDRLAIGNGKVVVNGEYEHKSARMGSPGVEEKTVPDGMVYVMGDNELHSFDSRTFGPVSSGSVIGKALFIFWPFGDWQRL